MGEQETSEAEAEGKRSADELEGREQAPERRREIIAAALRVFAESGFDRATIKRIAREAGLKSPALIYWYFKNKEELFLAVLAEHVPLVGMATQRHDPTLLFEQPPELVLAQMARGYLGILENPDLMRVMRIFLSELMRNPGLSAMFSHSGPALVLRFLSGYLARQVELGRLRPHDCQASARSFMGMLLVYVLGHELLPALREGFPTSEIYIQQVVGIFLDGLRS
jgi:TetR/AcrR family transcriptional regulator